MFDAVEPRDNVREMTGLRVSRFDPCGSESRRDVLVEVERARLFDRGAGGGGDGLAGRIDAMLAFLLSGRAGDVPSDDRGGVDARIEPLDGGGLGGGVRDPCCSNSYGGRGVLLLETLADASAVLDPVEPGPSGFALDAVLPFLGGGTSGAFDASLSLFVLICSTVTQPSSPSSLQGLPLRSGLRTKPSLGGCSLLATGFSPSIHHFLLSLLAGGKPGAIL